MQPLRFGSRRLWPRGPLAAVTVSPDGRTAIGASGDELVFWDVAARTARSRTEGAFDHLAWIDDDVLAVAGPELRLFDGWTWTCFRELERGPGSLVAFGRARDGVVRVAVARHERVRLLDSGCGRRSAAIRPTASFAS